MLLIWVPDTGTHVVHMGTHANDRHSHGIDMGTHVNVPIAGHGGNTGENDQAQDQLPGRPLHLPRATSTHIL